MPGVDFRRVKQVTEEGREFQNFMNIYRNALITNIAAALVPANMNKLNQKCYAKVSASKAFKI